MGRKPSITLTDAELRIMRVLWSRGPSTTIEIVDAIETPRLARNTVMTTLGVLERKGYVRHDTQGRTFVYEPLVQEDSVRRSAVRSVLDRFFAGSAEQLVVKLLDSEELSAEQRARIQQLLDQGTEE